MIFIYKYLCITLIFLYNFFPSWMLPLSNASLRLPVIRLFIIVVFLFFSTLMPKNLICNIKELVKYKFVRCIIYFILWEIFALLLLALLHGSFKIICLLNILMRGCGSLLMVVIGYFVAKQSKINLIIKFTFFLILSVYLYGVIDFLVYFFHINFLENILKFFMNARINDKVILLGTFPRIQAGFEEAAYYAYFVILTLPLAYYFYNCKQKISKNKYVNIVLKKSMPILALGTLILSQSPIYLIFAIVISLGYYFFSRKFSLIKTISFLLLSIFIGSFLLVVFLNVNLGDSFLTRIQVVLQSITSFKNLIIVEPSLATRICSYINMLCIFINYPILGCGTGNLTHTLERQFAYSPLQITPEIYQKSIIGSAGLLNASILFSTLAEQGIVGLVLFLGIFINFIKFINKIEKCSEYQYLKFIRSVKYVMVVFLLFSFYESFAYFQIIWILLGLMTGIFYQMKYKSRKENL